MSSRHSLPIQASTWARNGRMAQRPGVCATSGPTDGMRSRCLFATSETLPSWGEDFPAQLELTRSPKGRDPLAPSRHWLQMEIRRPRPHDSEDVTGRRPSRPSDEATFGEDRPMDPELLGRHCGNWCVGACHVDLRARDGSPVDSTAPLSGSYPSGPRSTVAPIPRRTPSTLPLLKVGQIPRFIVPHLGHRRLEEAPNGRNRWIAL